MSNPYDPNQGQQPAAHDPYGTPQPGQGGYGGNGGGGEQYGGGGPYGGNEPKGTDAVSITGFVLSLTCCLSIIGAILGFIGLRRTKNGQRKGRWAAVSATIIGIIGTLVFAGGVVFVVFVAKNVVTLDNAEVGQCVDVTKDDDDNVAFLKKDCDESHDAQIVSADDAGDDAGRVGGPQSAQVCLERVDSALAQQIKAGAYDLSAVVEDPKNVSSGDTLVCYVENADGSNLDSKIGS